MIHQLHTLLATLHLVHLYETYFRWTTFKLSEVRNWLFLIRIGFRHLVPNVTSRKISTLLDMGLPLRETYVRKSWGPQIPPRISEFYFPTLLSLVCLFGSWGFSVDCGSDHGGWNPRRMTNQMDPDPEARQKSFTRQLSGLFNLSSSLLLLNWRARRRLNDF